MASVRLPIDDETKSAAKAAAKKDGMTHSGWWIRLGRRALGLSDEVPPVHEMSMEDRLSASIKQADAQKEKP